jgi:hypothetical protein
MTLSVTTRTSNDVDGGDDPTVAGAAAGGRAQDGRR